MKNIPRIARGQPDGEHGCAACEMRDSLMLKTEQSHDVDRAGGKCQHPRAYPRPIWQSVDHGIGNKPSVTGCYLEKGFCSSILKPIPIFPKCFFCIPNRAGKFLTANHTLAATKSDEGGNGFVSKPRTDALWLLG